MKQEDKDLLLKDLCSRLPYNPMVDYKGESYNVLGITHGRLVLCKPFMSYTLNECPLVKEVKPYLFPLSSMTEEQKKELKNEVCPDGTGYFNEESLICPATHIGDSIPFKFMSKIIDWLNKNHFDYRGLIKKGLAIEAPEGMYN